MPCIVLERASCLLRLAHAWHQDTLQVVYGLVGSVGYFYFGEAATQLITADLQDMSQLGQLKLLGHIRVSPGRPSSTI